MLFHEREESDRVEQRTLGNNGARGGKAAARHQGRGCPDKGGSTYIGGVLIYIGWFISGLSLVYFWFISDKLPIQINKLL